MMPFCLDISNSRTQAASRILIEEKKGSKYWMDMLNSLKRYAHAHVLKFVSSRHDILAVHVAACESSLETGMSIS